MPMDLVHAGKLKHNYIVRRNLEGIMAKGCLQGSTLSHLMWSLVKDDLWELNSDGYYMVGYANDIAILINDEFYKTVCI
jgi:hypothetical protein